MKNRFKSGDRKTFAKKVEQQDTATFESGMVHPVYGTFALGRDAEWACRLFVLEMKEDDEEGIGTFLEVYHQSPVLQGSEVLFTAVVESISGHEIICSYQAHSSNRLIANGRTGQKILKKDRLNKLFSNLNSE